jgi:transcription antitermination factor NusG
MRQASAEGFEVVLPEVRVKPVNPRARKLVPYFPGYLFLHVDIRSVGVSTFQWMPFALGLVCFGGEPAAVPEALIVAIMRRVKEITLAGNLVPGSLKAGDPVLIVEGMFAGYQAIFDSHLSGAERVRVLLRLLNGQVKLELPASQVTRETRVVQFRPVSTNAF